MNEREIEKRLKAAIEKTAPNDFSGVLSRVSDEKGSKVMTMKKNYRKMISGAIAACRKRITIPMGGRAESLNAASASAILAWELKR